MGKHRKFRTTDQWYADNFAQINANYCQMAAISIRKRMLLDKPGGILQTRRYQFYRACTQ
jgi:hypothetical protein